MRKNPIQFGITREDPLLELAILEKFNLNSALLIASGGCTSLQLKFYKPDLKLTLFDFNPSQLELINEKISCLKNNPDFAKEINENLNSKGNFESLFKMWSTFIKEFVLYPHQVEDLFLGFWPVEKRIAEIMKNPYWDVSFDLFFSDSILITMFGNAAIQHAPRGSYPRYFKKVFEKGLLADKYHTNPFLQHLFLNKFITLEGYLNSVPENLDMEIILGDIFSLKDINSFDLIQLSNIFDWMDNESISKVVNHLKKEMKHASFLLLRQINNERCFENDFKDFIYHKDLSEKLTLADRSLFYNKITVLEKK